MKVYTSHWSVLGHMHDFINLLYLELKFSDNALLTTKILERGGEGGTVAEGENPSKPLPLYESLTLFRLH